MGIIHLPVPSPVPSLDLAPWTLLLVVYERRLCPNKIVAPGRMSGMGEGHVFSLQHAYRAQANKVLSNVPTLGNQE